MSSYVAPEQVMVTPDDRGPVINIVAWVTMVSMILAVMTKLASKLERCRKLMTDDLLAALAVTFAVAQTIAISLGVRDGLGKRQHHLNHHQLANVERALYASEILYIVAIAMSKLVTIRFISMLAPFEHVFRFTLGTYIFTGVWAFISVLGLAFQCTVPDAWRVFSANCFNQTAFWAAVGVLDILIEVILVTLPVYVLKPIDMDKMSKVSVIIAFIARAITIPVIIIRLYYLNVANRSHDRTFDNFGVVMSTQVQMNLVIILCCFPFLKTFLDGLQSGFLTSDLTTAPSAFLSHGASKERSIIDPFSHASVKRSSMLGRSLHSARPRSTSARPLNDGRRSDSFLNEADRQIAVETTVTIEHEENSHDESLGVQRTHRAMSYEEGIVDQLTGWH